MPGTPRRSAARRLAWVTASCARSHDIDVTLAVPALAAAGVAVDVVDWHDRDVDWASYEGVLLRSPWDYQDRLTEFIGWLDGVASCATLLNPLPMVRWSLDKHYLLDLAAAGVPVVPTDVLESPGPVALPAGPLVVKPVVGAGGRDAASYAAAEHPLAVRHAARLLGAGRAVLVQPRLASVARDGEWPLLFFAGRFSHAAAKRVALPSGAPAVGVEPQQTATSYTPSAAQRDLAEAVVSYVTGRFGVPVYARVDLVRDDSGRDLVLEVELAEPALFLDEGGPAAVRALVAALVG